MTTTINFFSIREEQITQPNYEYLQTRTTYPSINYAKVCELVFYFKNDDRFQDIIAGGTIKIKPHIPIINANPF